MQKRGVQNEILVGKGRCTLMCRRKEVHMDGRKCRIIKVYGGKKKEILVEEINNIYYNR